MKSANQQSGDQKRRSYGRMMLVVIVVMIVWTVLIGFGVIEGWARRPLAPRGDQAAFVAAVKARLEADHVGNAAFVLIDNGQIRAEHYISAGNPVDRDTLFQVASLSKWITAWGVMKLAEQGRIDLDAPVSTYVTRWQLPDGPFDENQVTPRRLLSHMAGLTDGLGYGGFEPGKEVQRLEDSLTRASDASEGNDGRVLVGVQPGEEFQYSGGGYALLQLMIEEVTAEPFDDYMRREILQPLGMKRSTFQQAPDQQNIAQSFDSKGKPAILYQFSAPSASALYTSAADLTALLQANFAGKDAVAAGRGILSPKSLAEMRRPHAYQYGAAIWGLGTILYAPAAGGGYIVGHDGSNTPAINTTARIDPVIGDGIVLLETGDPSLATEIAGEWVFWLSGNIDLLTVAADARQAIAVLAAGWLLGLIALIFFLVKLIGQRRRRSLTWNARVDNST